MGRRSYAGGGIFNIEEDEISHVDVMCYGASTGSLAVIVHGGVPPYKFSIDGENWQDEEYFDNLPVPANAVKSTDEYGGIWIGEYTMYCKDNFGRIKSVIASLKSPAQLVYLMPSDLPDYINASGQNYEEWFVCDAGADTFAVSVGSNVITPTLSTTANGAGTNETHTTINNSYRAGRYGILFSTYNNCKDSQGNVEESETTIYLMIAPRLLPNAVQDYDGNWYDAVIIGSQVWLGHNFIGTKAANGNSLDYKNPYNNSNYVPTYGRYYGFNTYKNNTFITGWHAPTNSEWDAMIAYVSSQSVYVAGGVAGNVAKALALDSGWKSSDTDYSPGNTPENNNLTFFSAKACGCFSGAMLNINWAYFWSGEIDASYARTYIFKYDSPASEYQRMSKSTYSSVRLVCDMNALDFIKWYWNTYGSFDHQLS